MDYKEPKSKIVTVSISINDIKENTSFLSIPEGYSENEIKDYLLEKYATTTGILEGLVDRNRIILQWYPERVDSKAEEYNRRALKFLKEKKYQEAIDLWHNAISLNNKDVEYLYKIALLFFETKRYEDCVKFLKRVVKICPIHHRAHLLLGLSLMKLRKIDEAQSCILESNFLNRSNVLTHLNLGVIYSIQRKFNKAIKMFNDTINLSPNETRAYLGLAKIYKMLNDVETSNKYFRKVIEIAPDSPMAHYAKRSISLPKSTENIYVDATKSREEYFTKGMNFYIAGDYKTSSSYYKSYLQAHPSDDYGWYLLGETRLRTGDIKEASDCFKRAIRLNSKRGLYYKALGVSSYFLGNSDEGVKSLKKAQELNKNDSLIMTVLGIQLMRLRRYEDAITEFKNAMNKNPNNPMAMYHLALALIQKDEKEKAIEIINRIISFDYYVPLKSSAKKLLQKLNGSPE